MTVSHKQKADALRMLAADAVQRANSGHPGMPMGMADVATVLFSDFLRFDAACPQWHGRDRFVLSAGHGSMLLYGLLHLCGYADFPLDELKRFRQLGARTAGHPEYGHGAGIETTTGPLGQGLANAVGMALAQRLLAAEFGGALFDHRVWTVVGDGCLMEGISHEAASLAGHLRLNRLVVLFDDNCISIDGKTDLAVSDDTLARFKSYGWAVDRCDGHCPDDIKRALAAACDADVTKPTFIACRTTIGYGAPNKAGTANAHGAPLGDDEVAAVRAQLGWEHPPFEIPDEIMRDWRAVGRRGTSMRAQWEAALAAHPQAAEIARRLRGELPPQWDAALVAWRDGAAADLKAATRKAGAEALARLAPALPELIGGSADLTGSNLTLSSGMAVVARPAADSDFETAAAGGRYVHYGVREHAMAAVMNGIALHGGFIPYGGTFLIFTDYCRPAIRLSALMNVRVVYVMTHDSIGLGEDGPTHQPIEHLSSLRAIPNLRVWRPCDAAETAECWRLSVLRQGPSVLALSRQGLPPVSDGRAAACGRGAYVLRDSGAGDERRLTLLASGSEVAIAVATQEALAADGINGIAVVSAPSLGLFAAQDAEYQQQTVPPDVPVLAVEAAEPMSLRALATQLKWQHYDDVALHTFGTSAPGDIAYQHFNLTPEQCTTRARQILNSPSTR